MVVGDSSAAYVLLSIMKLLRAVGICCAEGRELSYPKRTFFSMDELTVSPNGHDQLEVNRSMISLGQVFRLRLKQVDDSTVAVDLRIGQDDQLVGQFQGRLRISDLVPASRAVTSLLGGAATTLGRATVSTSTKARIEKDREKYPNAYTPWTAEDDSRLLELYRAKVRIAEIGRQFGRKPSAIKTRLEKVLPPEAGEDESSDELSQYEPSWVTDDFPSRHP